MQNSSGGFLTRLVELSVKHDDLYLNWLIVSEPIMAKEVIAGYLRLTHNIDLRIDILEELIELNWTSQNPNYDLCVPDLQFNIGKKFSAILHQSVLEHVVDPVMLLRNLSELIDVGGIIVLQTCNVFHDEHKFPIDTLRFFPDFFTHLSKYTNLQAKEVFNENGSIYAVLQKFKD